MTQYDRIQLGPDDPKAIGVERWAEQSIAVEYIEKNYTVSAGTILEKMLKVMLVMMLVTFMVMTQQI